jgi:hypothetical protein
MPLAVGQGPFLPRSGALHVVRLACERPDTLWHSLTQWDGQALARQLMAEAWRGHLRRHRPSDSGGASTQALAPSPLAASKKAGGLRRFIS